MPQWYEEIKHVISADGKETGDVTGGRRRCQMSGCGGVCLGVKWPDGRMSWPCTKGLVATTDKTIASIAFKG